MSIRMKQHPMILAEAMFHAVGRRAVSSQIKGGNLFLQHGRRCIGCRIDFGGRSGEYRRFASSSPSSSIPKERSQTLNDIDNASSSYSAQRISSTGFVTKPLTPIEDINKLQPGQKVILAGWLTQIRLISKHLAFAVLLLPRGKGKIQLIVRNEQDGKVNNIPDLWSRANLHGVVQVEGIINERPISARKQDNQFDKFELNVDSCTILNSVNSEDLPFDPTDLNRETNAEVKMRNRHLDLRSFQLGNNVRLRSKVTWEVRKFLQENDFDEIETPILLRSTPEGAREYLVPTRVANQSSSNKIEPQFYALQQSPQQPKQLLMASGVTNKYYQIARCFRDEGGRKDRQPEFTQIDVEMSFVQGQSNNSEPINAWTLGGQEVRKIIEQMVRVIWKAAGMENELEAIGKGEFQVMTYDEAMNKFGSDKPDLRYGLELVQLNDALLQSSELPKEERTRKVEILCFDPASSEMSVKKKEIERILEANDVKGVETFWVDSDSPNELAKLLLRKSKYVRGVLEENEVDASDVSIEVLKDLLIQAKEKGLVFTKEHDANFRKDSNKGKVEVSNKMCVFVASRPEKSEGGSTQLGDVRRFLMSGLESLNLLEPACLDDCKPRFLWVIEFPLFTKADQDKDFLAHGRWSSSHHPFTSPKLNDIDLVMGLLKDGAKRTEIEEHLLGSIKGQHYDLVLNGVEIGGGSVRIHDAELQRRILKNMLQLSDQEIARFDHLLRALSHGCPPHAGIALGLDRLMTILCRSNSIRDVLAFPKSNAGRDLLFGSPDAIGVLESDDQCSNIQSVQQKQDDVLLQYGLRTATNN